MQMHMLFKLKICDSCTDKRRSNSEAVNARRRERRKTTWILEDSTCEYCYHVIPKSKQRMHLLSDRRIIDFSWSKQSPRIAWATSVLKACISAAILRQQPRGGGGWIPNRS